MAAKLKKESIPTVAIFLSFFVLFCTICNAETYNWTDETGSVHYTDDPSSVPKGLRDKVRKIEEPEKHEYRRPKLVGLWSNKKDNFSTISCIFKEDGTGALVSAAGFTYDFIWEINNETEIELAFKVPKAYATQKLTVEERKKLEQRITGIYQSKPESINFEAGTDINKNVGTLYRISDEVPPQLGK